MRMNRMISNGASAFVAFALIAVGCLPSGGKTASSLGTEANRHVGEQIQDRDGQIRSEN